MIPHYNTFHQNSGQAHPASGNGDISVPSPQQQQQGMPFNTALANSCNMLPPSMGPQPGFMNLSNNIVLMQNNHMFMPMSPFGSLGPISQPGHPGVGFSVPQSNAVNMNLAASYPLNGQFCNMAQTVNQVNPNMGFLPGQLFAHNLLNLQQMNQNIGPYGQFCLPNLLNKNQVVPMQMQNPGQGGPYYAFGGINQAAQAGVPQNPAFFTTPNFGNVHSPNQARQQINQNQQNNSVQGTQGNHIKAGGVYNSNSDRKSSPSKSFIKHPKQGLQQQGGFQNSQFHHNKNAKGKFAFPNRQNSKEAGLSNEKGKSARADSMDHSRERKSERCLSLSYTEQEVQLWREGRRKNYPSNTNIEKKLSEKMMDSVAIQREATARKEQLKEILTKQAEMGLEVADIPSHYLSDSEKQGNRREENRSWKNNCRSQNKFGKRDRFDKKDRFAKRQRSSQKDSSNDPSFCKREPTLLQKLLSSDIKRDKSRLWQVFRFMVTNSFLKDFPDKPLKFPTVVVKESVVEEDVVEELSSVAGKGAYEGPDKSMVEILNNNDYIDSSYNDVHVEDDDEDEEVIERPEEEEGEIIN